MCEGREIFLLQKSWICICIRKNGFLRLREMGEKRFSMLESFLLFCQSVVRATCCLITKLISDPSLATWAKFIDSAPQLAGVLWVLPKVSAEPTQNGWGYSPCVSGKLNPCLFHQWMDWTWLNWGGNEWLLHYQPTNMQGFYSSLIQFLCREAMC